MSRPVEQGDNWKITALRIKSTDDPPSSGDEHSVVPDTALKRLESFAKCAVCGRMASRITTGKRGPWKHLL